MLGFEKKLEKSHKIKYGSKVGSKKAWFDCFLASPIMIIGVILTLWQFAVTFFKIDPILLPGIPAVLKALVNLYLVGGLLERILFSLGTIFLVLTISLIMSWLLVMLGIEKSFVMKQFRYLEAFLNPLPGIAMLPLVILWLGISYKAMLFIIGHAVFWPLWSQMTSRTTALYQNYKIMLSVFKVKWWRRWFYIYFLGSVSENLMAVKTAWSRGWRALISVEMIFGMVGKHSGMGWLIYEQRMYMDTAGLYASLLVIALMGLTLEKVIGYLGAKYDRNTHNA